MKLILVLAYLSVLYGCSGHIYTIKDPIIKPNEKVKGIPFYGHKMENKTVVLDRIRHSKTGDITNSAYENPNSTKYCKPDKRIDKVVVVDYSKPYYIYYEPGLFESKKFGVTLDKGMLVSVNSESTPGAKVAVETLQGIASLREDVLNGVGIQKSGGLNSTLTCTDEK